MPNDLSKYAENQFLSATVNRLSLMGELLAYSTPRLTAAANADPSFDEVQDILGAVVTAWNAGEVVRGNAEATQLSSTLAFSDKMLALTRKPDADTNSLLETWDSTIRSLVAYQGTIYTLLLPNGRETLTGGTIDEQLDSLSEFAVRLSQQTTKPGLVMLGTTVTAFANSARALRTAQLTAIAGASSARTALEGLRVQAAEALYGMVGFAMWRWRATPSLVDSLFSLSLLRDSSLSIPTAPVDTVWKAASRMLSTTTLPDHATRLEAWRLAPGGAPELLATGETDALSVTIPSTITFTPGVSYQFWLIAMNSKGSSHPSPITVWVA